MAETSIPYFQNSAGLQMIRISAREFMCIGAKPPFDHPHIYLDMGTESEIICPYCSTLYRRDSALTGVAASPAEALWHENEAA